jgi:AcrR family transcriptional regulator
MYQCTQVVSVARQDVAGPYINDFWPSNTCLGVVTGATSGTGEPAASLSPHGERTRPVTPFSKHFSSSSFGFSELRCTLDRMCITGSMTTATRRWTRTDATQQRILDAATAVFAARGFTAATMADVVDHSGASIGSIYHHFGGKKELFLAIFERLTADIDRHIDAAADKSGQLNGRQVFEANARAYLNAIWANRRAAMVLASGDTPAGFDLVRRRSMLRGFRRWMSVLELDTSPRGQLLTRILIAVMAEASGMVIMCDAPADVGPITDAAIELINHLTS